MHTSRGGRALALSAAFVAVFMLAGCHNGGSSPPPQITYPDVTTVAGVAGGAGMIDGSTADTGVSAPLMGHLSGGVVAASPSGKRLYVADHEYNVIREVDPATGAVTVLAGSAGSPGAADGTGTAASFNSPTGIATDGTYLYIADNGNNAVRRVEIATGTVETIDLGGATLNGPWGIAYASGKLYVSERGGNIISAISSTQTTGATVVTLAGSGNGTDLTDGLGVAADFRSPAGLATDGTTLYVADELNHAVRRVTIADGAVVTVAGTGARCYPTSEDCDAAGKFWNPRGVALDGTDLYVAEWGNQTIRRIDLSSGPPFGVVLFAGGFGTNASVADGGRLFRAAFNCPAGLALDGTVLYVMEWSGHVIRRLDLSSGGVSTLAGIANLGGSRNGAGTKPVFRNPSGVVSEGTKLYIADTDNHSLRIFDPAGQTVSTLSGTAARPGFADGPLDAAQFNAPYGIAAVSGAPPAFYVTDSGNHTVRKIDAAVSTFAGTAGSAGSQDGTGPSASFTNPTGITTDGTYLYIADTGNHTIRSVQLSDQAVATVAGSAGVPGSDDGTGTLATFDTPMGVATDGVFLYVADTANNTIRRVTIATGTVATIAGTAGAAGHTDGVGAAARFSGPSGIALDAAGTVLYVADTGNTRVRTMNLATGRVDTIAGSTTAGSADGNGPQASFSGPAGIAVLGTTVYVTDAEGVPGNNTVRMIQ